jgi:NitT/TauT family transport system permease protein
MTDQIAEKPITGVERGSGIVTRAAPRRGAVSGAKVLVPFSGLALLLVWEVAARRQETHILPGPWAVARGVVELAEKGLLLKYVVASLFRVTWGYLGAVALALPTGIALGWYARAQRALSPILQLFRPLSPLAWIPLAILWFGVGDLPAVFIIFLGSFFPMTLTVMNSVRNLSAVHVNAARNFGLNGVETLRLLILPAILPQLIVGLRLALGVAWLVVVAAEMIAVNSGLGFLIVDARNAGDRYDLVVAGMALIGLTGFGLDVSMRRLQRMPRLRWGYVGAAESAS